MLATYIGITPDWTLLLAGSAGLILLIVIALTALIGLRLQREWQRMVATTSSGGGDWHPSERAIDYKKTPPYLEGGEPFEVITKELAYLREQKAGAVRDIETKCTEIASLQHHSEALTQHVTDLQAKIAEGKRLLEVLAEETLEMQKYNNHLSSENLELQKLRDALSARGPDAGTPESAGLGDGTQTDLDNHRQALAALQRELESKHAEAAATQLRDQNILTQLRQKIFNAQQQYSTINTGISELQARQQALTAAHAAHTDEIEKRKGELSALHEELATRRQALTALNAEAEAQRQHNETQRQQYEARQAQLLEETAHSESLHHSLIAAVQELERRRTALLADQSTLADQIANGQMELARCQQELEAGRGSLATRNSEAAATQEQHLARLAEIRQEITQAQDRRAEMLAEINTLADQVAAGRLETARCQEALEAGRGSLATLNSEATATQEQHQARLGEIRQEITQAQGRRAEMLAEINTLADQVAGGQSETARWQEALDTRRGSLATLNSEATATHERHQGRLTEIRQEIARAESRQAEIVAQMNAVPQAREMPAAEPEVPSPMQTVRHEELPASRGPGSLDFASLDKVDAADAAPDKTPGLSEGDRKIGSEIGADAVAAADTGPQTAVAGEATPDAGDTETAPKTATVNQPDPAGASHVSTEPDTGAGATVSSAAAGDSAATAPQSPARTPESITATQRTPKPKDDVIGAVTLPVQQIFTGLMSALQGGFGELRPREATQRPPRRREPPLPPTPARSQVQAQPPTPAPAQAQARPLPPAPPPSQAQARPLPPAPAPAPSQAQTRPQRPLERSPTGSTAQPPSARPPGTGRAGQRPAGAGASAETMAFQALHAVDKALSSYLFSKPTPKGREKPAKLPQKK